MGPARVSANAVRTAARIVDAVIRGTRPVDKEVATGLKEAKKLDAQGRGDAVFLVGAALRKRAFLEAAVQELPFDARREGLILAALVDSGRKGPLNRDDELALEQAFAKVCARFTDDEITRMASPVPAWLCERFAEFVDDHEATELARAMSQEPPLTLRVNTLVDQRDELAHALASEGVETRYTAISPYGLVVVKRQPIHQLDTFRAGRFEIQDEGSQLLALLTDAGPGDTVVDGCAGAGGKTLALAAMMEGTGRLYAFDINTRRLTDLADRARRAQVHNLRVHALDAAGVAARKRLNDSVDAVLVDAPCSGSGTLRRAPDIGFRLDKDTVLRLIATQDEVLDNYAPLVKKGGRLVYATCSLLVEENEDVAQRFLARWPMFQAIPVDGFIPADAHGRDVGTVRLMPHRHGTDGFFAAVFVRA